MWKHLLQVISSSFVLGAVVIVAAVDYSTNVLLAVAFAGWATWMSSRHFLIGLRQRLKEASRQSVPLTDEQELSILQLVEFCKHDFINRLRQDALSKEEYETVAALDKCVKNLEDLAFILHSDGRVQVFQKDCGDEQNQ